MTSSSRISHKTEKSTKMQRSRRMRESILLPEGDERIVFDFREGDVCLNALQRLPPDLPSGYDLSGISGTIYTIRDHEGELGLLSDCRESLMRHCLEKGLRIRPLH